MKRNMMISSILALLMIVGLCKVAFGGGGFEGSGCEPENLPPPNSGPYLYGIFTVARDKSECTLFTHPDECGHYNVHAVLFRETKLHLFSFTSSMGVGDLCDSGIYNKWIKNEFASYPCMLEVGEAFGFGSTKYTPVITKVSIIKKDSCGTLDEMIYGLVTIRLVPHK